MLLKDETQATLTSKLMNFEDGATLAVHCVGQESDETQFKIQLNMLENVMVHNSYEFLDLQASADPTVPYIKAGLKYGEDKEKEDEMRTLNNW